MYRLSVILRHTFFEAIAQPLFVLMIVLASAIIFIFAKLPFFTLGEDTRMFKTVCMDVILLMTLVTTLLAASKSIYEEIEDRTMLTLMSKPVARWQVLVGKYLGLILSAAVMIAAIGLVLMWAVRDRVPNDYLLNINSLYDEVRRQVVEHQKMHLAGVYPSLVLIWLQISVLTALSVAISTRFAFLVNLPVVILLYLAGNLTRFIDAAVEERNAVVAGLGWVAETVLPYLYVFDLRDLTVFSDIKVAGPTYEAAPQGIAVSQLWAGTANAGLYAALYVIAALGVGLLMFQSRELGGAEG
jgi:hypothetical protein